MNEVLFADPENEAARAIKEIGEEWPRWDPKDPMAENMKRWQEVMIAVLEILEVRGRELAALEDEVRILRSGKDL